MERVPHHDGPETVLELLNRPEGFFAFRPAANHDVLLISKVQTVSLSVDRQAPIADPARLSAARMLGVELVLAGGSNPGGGPSAILPPTTRACPVNSTPRQTPSSPVGPLPAALSLNA